MRNKAAEYCTHVFEFILFLLLTLIVSGNIDLLRYLVEGKKPTVVQFLWVATGYAVVWMSAGLVSGRMGGIFGLVQNVLKPQVATVEEPAEAGD